MFDENETTIAIKQTSSHNIQGNQYVTERAHSATGHNQDLLPTVTEEREDMHLARHFPRLKPLTSNSIYNKNLLLKTRRALFAI